MKRASIFLGILGIAAAGAAAFEYPDMAFETVDAGSHYISVENLNISFSNSFLLASNGKETLQLPTDKLKTMQFSSNTSGISIPVKKTEEKVEVFTLSGIKVGHFASLSEAKSTLPNGIYIIKTKDSAFKLNVK